MRSKTHTITNNFDEEYEKIHEKMLENFAKFQKEGSGWKLSSIEKLEIFVTKFEPLAGKGHTTPLPKKLREKRAITNMKNDDN